MSLKQKILTEVKNGSNTIPTLINKFSNYSESDIIHIVNECICIGLLNCVDNFIFLPAAEDL